MLDNYATDGTHVESGLVFIQRRVLQPHQTVLSAGQMLRQAELKVLEIVVVPYDAVGDVAFLVEDAAQIGAPLAEGKALLLEVVYGHQALLAIDEQVAILVLLIQEELRHRQTEYEGLDEL